MKKVFFTLFLRSLFFVVFLGSLCGGGAILFNAEKPEKAEKAAVCISPAVNGAYMDYEAGFGGDGDGRLDAIMEREAEIIRDLDIRTRKGGQKPPEKKKFIKWCEFNVPYEALARAMSIDIASHKNNGVKIDWIELLTLLAVKYYGNFSSYNAKDIDRIAADIRGGKPPENLMNNKYYGFYKEVYTAVLGQFLGAYSIEKHAPDDAEKIITEEKYGLKVFSPIAAGYQYSHYDDFGNSRNFGYKRRHLGHDLMGSVGTPVIAVEGGVVTEIGWNRFGGWRVGIRSYDGKRYYYYAHLRKDRPYVKSLNKGSEVQAGDVIGYLGMTGYSTKENVNNVKPPHLHVGLQLIFDESQIKGASEIWVDMYAICRLLQKNRSLTFYDKETGDFTRKKV